ncbi:MAG TPA: hypothetical protein VM285_07815, partial [Polyangia bacterium]|nr:hypothetical protein [Polyangia bacterium]
MREGYFYLKGHEPVWTDDMYAWSKMFDDEPGGRHVAKTDVGEVFVSTVFLGIDHNYSGGPPLLFETMVFRGHLDERQWRYSTWDEAAAGHEEVVAHVKAGTEP